MFTILRNNLGLNCRSNTGEIRTMRGKMFEIVQDKKVSYTWNVDEYPDIPETIVTWTLKPLYEGRSSEIMLVHSAWSMTSTTQAVIGLISLEGLQSTAKRSSSSPLA